MCRLAVRMALSPSFSTLVRVDADATARRRQPAMGRHPLSVPSCGSMRMQHGTGLNSNHAPPALSVPSCGSMRMQRRALVGQREAAQKAFSTLVRVDADATGSHDGTTAPSKRSFSTLVRVDADATKTAEAVNQYVVNFQYPRAGRCGCNCSRIRSASTVGSTFSTLVRVDADATGPVSGGPATTPTLSVPSCGSMRMQQRASYQDLCYWLDFQYPRAGRCGCNRPYSSASAHAHRPFSTLVRVDADATRRRSRRPPY